jgi:hypothetical protein
VNCHDSTPRAFVGTLLLALMTGTAGAQSFAVRDQNPLLRGQYLPLPVTASAAHGGFINQFQLSTSNTATVETRDDESLSVDGESLELRWLAAWQPSGRFQMRFTVPLFHDSGGVLDGAIDAWHDAFGFSEGSRPNIENGEFTYRYTSAAGTVLQTESQTALGDTAIEGGFLLSQTTGATLRAWLGVELPTGERSHLTGNDAWDVSAWLEGDVSPGERLRLDGRAGAVRSGSAAPLPLEPRSWVAFGSVGATWVALPSLDLRLQVDAHDGFFEDTELRFLGPAVVLSVGAEYRSPAGWSFQFAISEDARVDGSPDVGLFFGLQIGGRAARVGPAP